MQYSEAISMAVDSVSIDNNLSLEKRKEVIEALIEAESLANHGYAAKVVLLTEKNGIKKL